MVDIFVFGHFFGFSSVANYAASIYPKGLELSQTIIKRFDFPDLIKKKNELEESYEFNKVFVEQIKSEKKTLSRRKEKKLRNHVDKIHYWLVELKGLQKVMEKRIVLDTETEKYVLSTRYLDIYSKAVMPLFPLAGTFSIVMLLLFGCGEAYKTDEIIFCNTILWVNIFMFGLIVYNIKLCPKEQSIWKRGFLLSFYLAGLTFIGGAISCLCFHFPNITLSKINNLKLVTISAFSAFFAGVPLFVILFKSTRLWFALLFYEKFFQFAFWRISRHLTIIQS